MSSSILKKIVESITQRHGSLWEGFDSGRELHKTLALQNRRMPLAFRLEDRGRLYVIAEIKQASPSQGRICHDFDVIKIADQYQKAGVDAISILTEEQHFLGKIDDLRELRSFVLSMPLLRKDFIIDPYQVHEAYRHGADMVLLIVAILTQDRLTELHRLVRAYGMQALVEVHNEEELERALDLEPSLLGINNRDLHSFRVDLDTTKRLAKKVPSHVAIVAESGIFSGADARFLQEAGARALLVGQGILQSEDYGKTIRSLKGEE